jgi:hypothetical protein
LLPYHRPPLSKRFLAGTLIGDRLLLHTHAAHYATTPSTCGWVLRRRTSTGRSGASRSPTAVFSEIRRAAAGHGQSSAPVASARRRTRRRALPAKRGGRVGCARAAPGGAWSSSAGLYRPRSGRHLGKRARRDRARGGGPRDESCGQPPPFRSL